MLTPEKIRSIINLKEISDQDLNAVIPGARALMRSRMGSKIHKDYEYALINPSEADSLLQEELLLAETYYAVSLLPTSLLLIQKNSVLIDSSQWGQGKETYSTLDDINKLKQTLTDQANAIIDSYLIEITPKNFPCKFRVI